MFEELKLAFTPFTDASIGKKIKYTIIASWIFIFISLWKQAPPLWPSLMDILNVLKVFLTSTDFYYDVLASFFLTLKAMVLSIIIATIFSYLYTIPFFKPLIKFVLNLRFMSLLGFLFVFMSLLHDASRVKLAILSFSIIPFFTLSLVSMIDRIPQKEFDLWITLKYSKWEQLREIIIIGKMDYVIEAIAANFAMAWLMMTVAESKSMADGGLGVLLFKCDKYNNLDKIFALQIVIFILGMSLSFLIKNLRYKLFPYKKLVEIKN
jgi:NitT/TauT family transport system permease protein